MESELSSKVSKILNEKEITLENIELHILEPTAKPIPPHQDNFYHAIQDGDGLKILIPLNKLDTNCGGLHFYNVPKEFGILEHKASATENFSSYIDEEDLGSVYVGITKYRYQEGDASYHFLNNIHFSTGNKSQKDTAFFVVRYHRKTVKIDQERVEIYNSTYREHIKRIEGGGKRE